MSDYEATDKTDWFIRKLSGGWFSRQEIMKLAATEFPTVSWKLINGTIGQYWTDSVNPNWETYKAIRGRRLTVREKGRRRHIVDETGDPTSLLGIDLISTEETLQAGPAKTVTDAKSSDANDNLKSTLAGIYPESKARGLWNSDDPGLWKQALNRYWTFVRPANIALEMEMDQLDSMMVRQMDPLDWYTFLLEKYFRWKYTALNRYSSTTKMLRKYAVNDELHVLHGIKDRLFAADKDDVQQCLIVAKSIRGLGTAGASGLLAVLFPTHFGTVDQFAVKALAQIPEIQERDLIAVMNPESLNLNEGVMLIRIMRRKADDLNRTFSTSEWTPRKVDMVLWTCAR